MGPGQARFVTACQQLLVLGVVLAVLTPAASVISLDVVGRAPGSPPSAAVARPASATVPIDSVEPVVQEYPLTAAPGRKVTAGSLPARIRAGGAPGSTELVADPQPVTGYGAVGVTWSADEKVPSDRFALQVRTLTGDDWSNWTDLAYDEDHGPDPGSAEAQHSRPGTDALLVGEVDQVQVRAEATTAIPADLTLAVIDPGTATATRRERPAIDTAALGSTVTPGVPDDEESPEIKATGSEMADDLTEDGIALQAATYTPKPKIFSRAQWGANESMRDKGSLHYFEVHAGFVHHTVNANSYTRAQVPALLRGIYAYHTRSRGWSDIGYNFLVDRFGRIWEGRAGGVDRPVVGAHTLGYNDYAFAMSAIGNFETAKPSGAVLRAYGALFAWKLSLHGVSASSTSQQVGPRKFRAINGHRDAAATACPGRHLYARLATIRTLAAADQASWSGRERSADLTSSPYPDLVVRRASDGRAFVISTGGLTRFRAAQALDPAWGADHRVVAAPDLTGDRHGDLLVRSPSGVARVYPGDGAGRFGEPLRATRSFRNRDQISAVGDLNGDGHQDLIGRATTNGRLDAYLGTGRGTFKRRSLGGDWSGYARITGAGDVSGDGNVDLVAVDRSGRAWLRRGSGSGSVGGPVALARSFAGYDVVTGLGDYGRDRRSDLFVRSSASGIGQVLPSRGDGDYSRARGRVARVGSLVPSSVTGADLTGNTAPDLVGRRGNAWVLLAHRGTFETGRAVDAGFDLSRVNLILNVGDWDGDGHGDLILRSSVTGDLVLRRGDGAGGFSAAQLVGEDFSRVRLLAAVGDMTGDGQPDLMGQPAGGSMRLYPGAGTDGLRRSYSAYGAIRATRHLGVGRWNGDGAPDSLLRRGGTVRLYPGNGPGGLTTAVRTVDTKVARYDWMLGLGDVDRDGHADVVARSKATGELWLLPGTNAGFGTRRLLDDGLSGYDLAG